jgi:hypothetical protein
MNMTPGVASIVVFLASTGCGAAPGPAVEESKTVNTEKQEAQEPTGKIAELKEFVGTWKIN